MICNYDSCNCSCNNRAHPHLVSRPHILYKNACCESCKGGMLLFNILDRRCLNDIYYCSKCFNSLELKSPWKPRKIYKPRQTGKRGPYRKSINNELTLQNYINRNTTLN
jgi:hypothetical protein